ncbi:hypothetical protein CTA1_8480 [Colletotrichum tanaceti]|uniref:Uncharacterized protein n=1 Tax=Colletotrichum tanaceti TaxID=1306861 RepID=A0A4U6X9W6_9PEZI|nr:hypothetical protein CTA1_8480 [Colletotrichum tanaceti]
MATTRLTSSLRLPNTLGTSTILVDGDPSARTTAKNTTTDALLRAGIDDLATVSGLEPHERTPRGG